MKTTHITVINTRNCKYTWDGENISEMRLVRLRKIAAAVGVTGDLTKNEMLTLMLGRFRKMDAPLELTEIKPSSLQPSVADPPPDQDDEQETPKPAKKKATRKKASKKKASKK